MREGRFLLLGSASLELIQQSSETLAGRIAERCRRIMKEMDRIARLGKNLQEWYWRHGQQRTGLWTLGIGAEFHETSG